MAIGSINLHPKFRGEGTKTFRPWFRSPIPGGEMAKPVAKGVGSFRLHTIVSRVRGQEKPFDGSIANRCRGDLVICRFSSFRCPVRGAQQSVSMGPPEEGDFQGRSNGGWTRGCPQEEEYTQAS